MKSLSFCFVLLCIPLIANSQENPKRDSLLQVYKDQPDGIEKVNTINALFNATMYQDTELAKRYADEMLSLSKTIKYDKGVALSLYQLGVYHTNLNNLDSAKTYYQQSIKLQEQVGDKKTEANAIDGLAILEYSQGNYEKALELLEETMVFYKTAPMDSSSIASTHSFRASIFINQGKYNIALKECMAALNIYNQIDDEIRKADALGVLAYVETSLENFEKAIDYNQEALEIYQEYNDIYFSAQALNDIGNLHYYLKQYEEALDNLQKSLALSEKSKSSDLKATTLGNIGKVYADLNQTEKALKNHNEALAIVRENENRFKECEILNDIGIAHNKADQPYKAIPYFDKAIEIGKEIQSAKTLEISYYQRSLSYGQLDQAVAELSNFKEYTKIHDSILNLEKSRQIEELRTIYDLEKKEQQIVLQENEIEILDQEARISNLQRILLAIGLLLSVIGFYAVRQKLKRSKAERKILDDELAYKKKELTTHALHLAKKNEVLENLKQKAKELKKSENGSRGYQQLIQTINFDQQDDKNWENFTQYFEQVHKNFSSLVKERYPEVTKNELRFMALIKMNMSSKEIATILNISSDGVKKARQRLRKKMNLRPEDSLENEVLAI